jgi:2-hydroxy-3-keto-5-methylthiopentenyl-1-phosphate phosphatase
MARHAALLRATPDELDAAIRAMRIDPSFHAFVGFCRRRRVDLTIVSDGFDRVVRTLLDCEGLPLPFFANRLEWQGGDRWSLAFPHGDVGCRSQGGNCKCSHGADQPGACVVIGDGRSDFCMAERADYVIAKGALAHFCRERGLQYASFTTFDDVTARLARWLARRGRSARAKPSPLKTQPWGWRT